MFKFRFLEIDSTFLGAIQIIGDTFLNSSPHLPCEIILSMKLCKRKKNDFIYEQDGSSDMLYILI